MKINKNLSTIIIVAVAIVVVYMITRSDVFQMEYYQTPNASTAGQMY
tara:strand:+ start:633 stop:773 length:141 start_codon:yes stop_codon:yes gene_type:complete